MNLPEGVSYHPRQESLIKMDESAIIWIDTSCYPDNSGYQINERTFEQAVSPYLCGDWADFDRLFRLDPGPVVYSGAEHNGSPKLPNITVIRNLKTMECRGLGKPFTVFGCTMGHFHQPLEGAPDYWVQEVYEFQSYGLLVVDQEAGEVEVWVAQQGDKVAVPNGAHMTLYNLADEDSPLVTLDFADPKRNPSNKDLASHYGPILLAYYDDSEVVFALNQLYVNNPDHKAGVHLASSLTEQRERQVRIARGARLDLGRLLYEQLTQNPEVIGRFSQLGLSVRRASREAALEPLPSGQGSRLYFSLPLVEAATQGSDVYRYFFPATPSATASLPSGRGIAAVQSEITGEKRNLIQLERKYGPLVILVEGAGDWVEQCYRPRFKEKVGEGKKISVFYADDTRWKGTPKWANHLEKWEVYLDKADPSDFAKYQSLRTDVVFIVTPDFTHSAIARGWLGKAPLVFVEKPFDSQLDNVDILLRELGQLQLPRTAVLGLDHYQFYALPLHELMPKIEEHLGGALSEVVFFMTENRPIELGRERTLQYGLTLDLLPHMLALLTYFGDVDTIDEIRVIEAGQYDPLFAANLGGTCEEDISASFRNETYSLVKFTFQDYSGTGYHIPCVAVVGKGFSQGPKYLEITGRNGNAIRVDLNKKPNPDPVPGYPWDSLFFLHDGQGSFQSGAQLQEVSDPYNQQRILRTLYGGNDPQDFCRSLERVRYGKLLDDLLNGTSNAVVSTLLLPEATQIVRAIDRIWWAIQASREQWIHYKLNKTNPIKL